MTWNTCSFKVRWEPEPEPNQHCSQMFVSHSLTMFGLRCSLLDVHVVARQVNLIMHPFLAFEDILAASEHLKLVLTSFCEGNIKCVSWKIVLFFFELFFCWGSNVSWPCFHGCSDAVTSIFVCARWVQGLSSCCLTTLSWAEGFSCTASLPWSLSCSVSLTPCFISPTSCPWCPNLSSEPRVSRWSTPFPPPLWSCSLPPLCIIFYFSQSSSLLFYFIHPHQHIMTPNHNYNMQNSATH